MGKHETERVKEYIRDDRPRRLKSYTKKHKLDLPLIGLKMNRNLLHYCCKHGSGTMFSHLHREGVSIDQSDSDGNTPLHLALTRAHKYEASGKGQLATDCYTDIILPCIERCPGLLDARNDADETCRELLRRLAEHRESQMPPKRRISPESSPDRHTDMSERMWRDKLADEHQYEYETTWGHHEAAFPASLADHETYDDWAERIQQQYYARKRAKSARSSTSNKKRKTSQEPRKTQAGPDNLEEIRAKMREDFERRTKEDNEMKVLKERMRYEKRYKELLDSKEKAELGYDDIPWPSKKGGNSDMTLLFDGMEKGDNPYRKYLRDQQIRWHPDKFMQRFGEHLQQSDKDRILARVTKLSQELNALLK